MDVAEHVPAPPDDEPHPRGGVHWRSGPSALRCDACGDAIPPAEAGTEHCFDCIEALRRLAERSFR
jgi:hypothetical protein